MLAKHKQLVTLVAPTTEFVVDPAGHAVQEDIPPVEDMYVLARHKQLVTLVAPAIDFVVDPAGHAVQPVAPVEGIYVSTIHKVHEVAKLVVDK